jgi:predicted acylesterase/phospholipase RssA
MSHYIPARILVKKIGEVKPLKRPLFDIVNGTSIGAWNAAVVVSNTAREVGTYS